MEQAVKQIVHPNQVRISYFERGTAAGIPVILIHGLADSWRVFTPLIAYLPEYMHIYAISLRGHGDSSRPSSGYRTRDFEGDLLMFMDILHIEKAVIVGASSGGFTARSFAIHHPERTMALVLLGSPATLQGQPDVQEFWSSNISRLTDPVPLDFVESFLKNTLSKPILQEFFEMMLEENLKLPARVWRETTEGILKEEFPGDVGEISSPTLILWGDQDTILSRASQDDLSKAIPGSRLVVRTGVAHMLYCEDPEGVASDITSFIGQITR